VLAIRKCLRAFTLSHNVTAPSSFVVVSVLSNKQQTSVEKRTLNPVWPPKEATFDFPIYLSLAEKLGNVELVIWDKDKLRKDYLGEVSIPLEDWFRDDNAYPFDDPNNKVPTFSVLDNGHTLNTRSRSLSTLSLHAYLRKLRELYK
jgi:phosphatidylserine decarboxylase